MTDLDRLQALAERLRKRARCWDMWIGDNAACEMEFSPEQQRKHRATDMGAADGLDALIAEIEALRECVKAADAMRKMVALNNMYEPNGRLDRYDTERAKVPK